MVASRASWSDDQVRDFVAGRMDAASSAQLSAQVQHDLALAGRVARERALRRGVASGATGNAAASSGNAAAGVTPPAETTPASVTPSAPATISSASVDMPPAAAAPVHAAPASATPHHAGSGSPSAAWWMLALLVVLLAGFAGWRIPRPTDAPLIADDNGLHAANRLEQALSTRIAAEGSTAEGVLVSLSFKAIDGRYCRTFSLDVGMDGLACRTGREWRVEAVGRSPEVAPPGEGGARQPSPSLSPTVLTAISRWQAGNALTPEEERGVRDRDWR